MLKNNRTFFLLFIFFLIPGAILLGTATQGDVILFFSENRSSFGDAFFTWFTKAGEEHMYITLILSLLFVRFRYSALVALCGGLALGVSFLLKSIFSHPRPSVYFKDLGILDQINTIDGVYLLKGSLSFPSGHTTSAFLLFGLMAFLFARKWYWNAALFFVALLIGISRTYLVQHFFKDVYAGAITGLLLAMFVWWINEKYPINEQRFIDRSLWNRNGNKRQV